VNGQTDERPAFSRGLDPFPWYAQMRQASPVWLDAGSGTWHVFAYDHVQRVLSDHAAFSSRLNAGGGSPIGASIIAADPPRHTQLRSLVSQAFTPRAVARLEVRIREIVGGLLDDVARRGEMDIVDDLAYPLPVIVIAELLGIPPEDRARFKVWSDALVTGQQRGGGPGGDLQREMTAYFMETVTRRRAAPGDDLISGLLQAQIEGSHLGLPEVLGFCVLLLVAGNETTTNLIANAVLTVQEHAGMAEALVAGPDLLVPAIEEVLRFRSPVQVMFRTACTDLRLGDADIPAGAHIAAWIGSANRDESQFPDAAHFDPARSPNRHLAFGQGIHFCLGAPLARLEAVIALGELWRRCANLRLVPGTVPERMASHVVFGPQHLPVTFRPA